MRTTSTQRHPASHASRSSVIGSSLVGALLLATMSPVHSQTVYTWTDERGVVHFSDVPPSGGQPFEERGAPAAEAATSADPSGSAASARVESAPEAAVESTPGPARVILTSHQDFPRGGNARHVIGLVKNVGGSVAARVGITAHVADSQGRECTREEIDVLPSTLQPGESGNFDGTITSGCFADGGTVDAEPHWD
jgi:hypothetical protein